VARRTADSAIDPEAADVTEIEEAQADLLRRVRLPRSFVLPGANRLSAEIPLARTVCRRAERSCVSAVRGHGEAGFETFVPVLNRLSDYLFVLALVADPEAGPTEMA
jgi:cob(I)alamin adenosyltransferase